MRYRFLLVLAVACGSGAGGPTLRQFLEVQRSTGGTLSPDGSRVAFVSNRTGIFQGWIAPRDGGTPTQLTTIPSGIGVLAWSPTGDELVFSADKDGDQQHQLYRMSAAGGAPERLTTGPDIKHDFGGWSHDGRSIYYAANDRDRRYFDCYLLDVRTKQARRVLSRDAVLHAAALSADATKIAAVDRISEVDQNIYVGDVATGAAQLVTPHTGVARFRVVGFSPDAKRLYVTTDLDRDFVNLAAIDLATTAITFLETERADTDNARSSSDGTKIALTHNRDGYVDLSIVDAATGRTILTPELPRGINWPTGWSGDDRHLAIAVSPPTHDDEVYVLDLATRRSTRVTHSSQAGIDERTLVVPELIHYPGKDGLGIPAFLYLPKRGGRHPVILSIHGGPEDQEQPWFTAHYQYFLSRGYAILAPNIRGSTGYGKQYLALDNGAKRWDALADLAAAVAWLRARPDIDGTRIVAFGYSYGGFATLAMLAHYPQLFAGGVDLYGPADLTTFLNRTAAYRRGQRMAEYGDPAKDAAFLDAISPLKHVDKMVAPLLVIQGGNDPIVPPSESQQLVDQLRARGRTVRYLLLPDEGHGFQKQVNQIRAYEEMVTFLASISGA